MMDYEVVWDGTRERGRGYLSALSAVHPLIETPPDVKGGGARPNNEPKATIKSRPPRYGTRRWHVWRDVADHPGTSITEIRQRLPLLSRGDVTKDAHELYRYVGVLRRERGLGPLCRPDGVIYMGVVWRYWVLEMPPEE